jgi:hypothetical protein
MEECDILGFNGLVYLDSGEVFLIYPVLWDLFTLKMVQGVGYVGS